MKLRKLIPFLLIAPLMASCGDDEEEQKHQKDPLVIPTVDVEKLTIDLPEIPEYNKGNIRTDGTYDYLDIYEISDMHGAVNSEQHSSGAYIGLPKLATFLNEMRSTNEGGTVVVSSGDMFQGSADSNLTRGYLVNYSMHYMGFDSMAIGNHEFDWTDAWMKKNAELKYGDLEQIPYLGINIIDKRTQEIPTFLKKSTKIQRGEYTIGIIGSIGNELETSILKSCVENYDFVAEKELIENEAQALRDDGCDVVILTAHQGVNRLEAFNGVDAIFGGHAHENKVGSLTVPCAATKNYGQGIAHIELKIKKDDKTDVSGTAEVITPYISEEGDSGEGMRPYCIAGLEDNTDIVSIMNQYSTEVDKIKNIKLGTTPAELPYDNQLKNIATQTMFDYAKKAAATPGSTVDPNKIIAAFHNVQGGIRANIDAGEITYGKVYSPFPFDNEIVLYKLKGMDMIFNSQVLARYGACKTFQTRDDLKLGEDYYIVLTDYLALSDMKLTDADIIRTGYNVRDAVAEKIYELETINLDTFANGNPKYDSMSPSF